MYRAARERIVAVEILKLELRLARRRAERERLVRTKPLDAGRR
jgi:hypothetical protein